MVYWRIGILEQMFDVWNGWECVYIQVQAKCGVHTLIACQRMRVTWIKVYLFSHRIEIWANTLTVKQQTWTLFATVLHMLRKTRKETTSSENCMSWKFHRKCVACVRACVFNSHIYLINSFTSVNIIMFLFDLTRIIFLIPFHPIVTHFRVN